MGIEKARMLAYESIHWISINTDVEVAMKSCPTYVDYQATSKRTKYCHTNYQGPWESVGTDIFRINNKHYIY